MSITYGSKYVYLWHCYKSRTIILTLANSIGLGRRHITMTSNLTSHTVFSHLVTNWGLSFSTRLPTSSSIIYAVEWNHWKTMLTSRAKLSVGVFSLGVQRLTCKQNILNFSLYLLQIAEKQETSVLSDSLTNKGTKTWGGDYSTTIKLNRKHCESNKHLNINNKIICNY